MIPIDQHYEPDLETILNSPATPDQIENAGLQYRFTWGYDAPVYQDQQDTLYAFTPAENGYYRMLLYIVGEDTYASQNQG